MKSNILTIAAVALGTALLGGSAQADIKVGTIDMKQVFDTYYKTKDAEGKINEARTQAKKELDERLDSFNKRPTSPSFPQQPKRTSQSF